MITLRNKIGQMLIIGFTESSIDNKSEVTDWLIGDGLGGVLLFDKDVATGSYGKNLVNKTQIQQLLKNIHYFASHSATQLPVFTAIDYEGGAVDRLSTIEGCMPTMKACDQSLLSTEAFVEEITQMAFSLKELGFNLNFAPVVDLKINEKQGIIGSLGRSFSVDPQIVVNKAKQFVDIFNAHGICCSYKHFPGHGSAKEDSHLGFVDITKTWQSTELEPYQQLVKDNTQATMIMTAHVIHKNLDDKALPATLSRVILNDLLRKELGYEGVIISDDLQMRAITSHFDLNEALALTINAGADMVIFGNQWGYISATEVVDKIEKLVRDQVIDSSRIDEAYSRIVRLKMRLNLAFV